LSWINIDLEFDINFSKFIHLINPLHDFQVQQQLASLDFFQFPSASPPLSCFAMMNQFGPSSSFNVLLQNTLPPNVPSSPADLPVVLDTGASVSSSGGENM
jgi:hypothetical protein